MCFFVPFVANDSVKKALAIVAVWAALGVLYASPIYFEMRAAEHGHAAWRIFSWGILIWLSWAPLTHNGLGRAQVLARRRRMEEESASPPTDFPAHFRD
jgi:hypothetical protein